MAITSQQSVRIRVLAEAVQQATRAHEDSDRKLKNAVAEFNDYVRSLEAKEPR